MGVAVSSGEHEITAEYHVPGLKAGLLLSVIGLLIMGCCMLIKVGRHKG
jgi:uncharacterized membrane protein YfhO